MTPEQFSAEIDEVMARNGRDHKGAHADTDDLMEKILIELGYAEGVAKIRKATRWYA